MDEVIKQAPNDIAVEDIEVIFKKNKENVIDTLIDLWNIEVKDAKDVKAENNEAAADAADAEFDFTNPETKWDNIRNICDAYDIEMQAHLNRLKGNSN
jgi:hypothetical protein|uniref:Uncharacterized protein n=1 Tax=viral metagenome TaxID=1070528 RepID=A0A6C0IBI7_9ZZZZ